MQGTLRRHGLYAVRPEPEDGRPVDRATLGRVVRTFRPYRGRVVLVAIAIAFAWRNSH